jgi:serine-type D-Ala-D-Ala carboxypeptidase/endopeptidase
MAEPRKIFILLLKIAAGVAVLFAIAFAALLFYVGTKQREFKSMPDTSDLKARIDQLAAPYINKRKQGALVVGVLQKDRRYVKGFGRQGETTNAPPPDGRTIFEIGSVTKVFTATALAHMLHTGKLKLDDPVQQFLPAHLKLPEKGGRAITLKHLATHSSGLPRLPDNLFGTAKDKNNPYANYTAQHLYQFLTNASLASVPGEKANYSNLGFALLGHALELRAGERYEDLIKRTICQPLEMQDTVMTLSAAQRERLTPGHDAKGRVVANWDFDVTAPAGAFRSTADDLLKFLAAQLKPNDTVLSRALQETHKRHFEHWMGDCGLGWQIMKTAEEVTIRWHNGGTGGYASFIGFDRQNQNAVVLLSNCGDAMAGDHSLDKLAVEILKLAAKISL